MKIIPFTRFTVSGHSMIPTLNPGQNILVFNWFYIFVKPKIGDIVVIKVGSKEMVKRVRSIVDRNIFVMGDNPTDSLDSRKFGPIGKNQIIGKVVWY